MSTKNRNWFTVVFVFYTAGHASTVSVGCDEIKQKTA